ncbi:hypothetical protein [Pseudomonas sp. LFM046]|uniref:hypothetical protein n=1 Tax=Pseudomonas sp. LFM046 TaxID=1608357 RepID=UPI0005CF9DD2|nr:hypothetical protein [Pseudomonas sp. LFM046]
MKGFQTRSSRWLKVLLIGLVVLLGLFAEQKLREHLKSAPLQLPASDQTGFIAPSHAGGPLQEVSQTGQGEFRIQPRWVF